MKHFFIIRKLVFIVLIGLFLVSYLSYGDDSSQRTRSVQAPPELFVPADLFPCNGKYESVSGSLITWPLGISLRYLGSRDFSQFDTLPILGGGWKTYTYNSTTAYEISYNGGLTWSTGTSPAFNSIRLNHVADTGVTRYFDAEVLALNIAGGSLPGGTMFRESPTLASTGKVKVRDVAGGFMIDSFFDIWLEISADGGMTWYPAPGALTIEFSYYSAESFFITNVFPPLGNYVSQTGTSIKFQTGSIVRNIVKRFPTASIPPPPPGPPVIHAYSDLMLFQLSLDQGGTWIDIVAPCINTSQLTFMAIDPPTNLYAGEHLAMTCAGGNLPPGVMLRESPTRASTGQYTTRLTMLGYMINSFFDVFLEMTMDGGMTWFPADNSIMLELYECPTITIEPATLPAGQVGNEFSQTLIASGGTPPYTFTIESGSLPPDMTLTTDGVLSGLASDYGFFTFIVLVEDQNYCQGRQSYTMTIYSPEHLCGSDVFPPYGRYVSKPGSMIYYPMGIMIRNMVHRTLRPFAATPALGMQQIYPFTGFLSFEVSLDQGATWTYSKVKTPNTVILDHTADSTSESFFDVEIVQMDISGGALPLGTLIRESPTLRSIGRLTIEGKDDFVCDSFFDIFTEISIDGGMTWAPALNDIYMELNYLPITLTNTDYFPPDGAYKSKNKTIYWHNGVALRSMKHYDLNPPDSPPLSGESKIFNYTGLVEFELSLDNGLTWMDMQASATNSSYLDHFDDDDPMNFYDTEMLQFDISGGTLPPGVLLRESPTKISMGEFNARKKSSDSWRVDSFFDIFFEVSIDGGMSWSPSIEPLELILSESNLDIVLATNWNMISLPLIVSDPRKVIQFVNAISPAYAYEGTYVEKETLSNGVGYWLKYGGSETISISGRAIFEDTIDVVEGWNMIGSISVPVEVIEITSIPEGIVTSEFFGYTTAYNSTDTIQPGKGYWVKVSQAGQIILSIYGGERSASEKISIVPISELPPAPPTDEENNVLQSTLPLKAALHQNSPNPFNPSTTIKYDLIENTRMTLKVYNVFGQEVATLVDGMQEAGYKSVKLNTIGLASGIYFYRLTAGNFTDTKKMILCK